MKMSEIYFETKKAGVNMRSMYFEYLFALSSIGFVLFGGSSFMMLVIGIIVYFNSIATVVAMMMVFNGKEDLKCNDIAGTSWKEICITHLKNTALNKFLTVAYLSFGAMNVNVYLFAIALTTTIIGWAMVTARIIPFEKQEVPNVA